MAAKAPVVFNGSNVFQQIQSADHLDLTNATVNTQSPLNNSTKAASTAYVDAAVTAGGGGGGHVNGPSPTVVDALAVWNNTTGTLLRNSTVLLDHANNDKLLYNASVPLAQTAVAVANVYTLDLDVSDTWILPAVSVTTQVHLTNYSVGQVVRIFMTTGVTYFDWTTGTSNLIYWNGGNAPFDAIWTCVTLICEALSYGNAVFYERARTQASNTFPTGFFISGGAAEEAVYDNGNSGTSKTIAWDNGNLQKVSITGAVTLAQTAPTHPGKFTLIVTQDGTGHVYAMPSGIKWAGGTAPTYSIAASKVDIFSVIYDGSNYYGMAGIAFS